MEQQKVNNKETINKNGENMVRDKKGQFIEGHPFLADKDKVGRPKGSISIKTEIIKRLEENPEELKEVVEYFIKNNRELMWQMIEGRPPQNLDITTKGKSFIKPTPEELEEANRAIEQL